MNEIQHINNLTFPEWPSFIQRDIWKGFGEHFQEELREEFTAKGKPIPLFPHMKCAMYAKDLFLLIAMTYRSWFDLNDSVLRLEIEGEEGTLCFQSDYRMYHCFLLLSLKDQTWVIDPTWKQIAAATNDDHPFHSQLMVFPDILIATKERVVSFVQGIRAKTWPGALQPIEYWNMGKLEDGNFYMSNEEFYQQLSFCGGYSGSKNRDIDFLYSAKKKNKYWNERWPKYRRLTGSESDSVKVFINQLISPFQGIQIYASSLFNS